MSRMISAMPSPAPVMLSGGPFWRQKPGSAREAGYRPSGGSPVQSSSSRELMGQWWQAPPRDYERSPRGYLPRVTTQPLTDTEVPKHPHTGRNESEQERLDRNLQEFLGELRVALPGVQVLFAFLLVVPFNQRFADITDFQKTTYFVTLLFTAAASVCLIAPTAQHRVEFRHQHKEQILMLANRLAIVGLGFLAVAMTGAIMLITDFLYGSTTTIIVTVVVGLGFAFLWYLVPVRRLAVER
jgi:hypothetical protein